MERMKEEDMEYRTWKSYISFLLSLAGFIAFIWWAFFKKVNSIFS